MKRLIVGLTMLFFLLLANFAVAGEYIVKNGDCLSKIGQQSGVAWQKIAKANSIKSPYIIEIGQILQIPSTIVVEKKTVAQVSSSSEYLETIRTLQAEIAALELKLKKAEAPVLVVAEVEPAPVTVKEVPAPVVKAEETTAPASMASNDKFSAYMSGGAWKAFSTEKASEGQFLTGKIGYRPFIFNISGREVGVGGFLLGETGTGLSQDKYRFNWYKLGGGASAKVYGEGWDNSTDLGITGQFDSSDSSRQDTYAAYLYNNLNLEQRRASGKALLPQTEVGFYASVPISSEKESATGVRMTADNKFVIGAEIKQSIYDLSISKNHKLVPGLMAGIGYEGNNPYAKLGPFLKWRAYNQDIIFLELFSKKVSGVDGIRGYGLLSLNLGGVIKAVNSALITQPTAEDLRVN